MVSTVGNEQRSSGGILMPILGAAAVGGISGAVAKRNITGLEALSQDKFELSKDAKLTPEQQGAYDSVIESRQTVASTANHILGDKNEITVEEYIKGLSSGKGAPYTVETGKAEIKTVEDKITELQGKLKGLAKDSTDATSLTAEIEKLTSENRGNRAVLELIETAKDGKITKEALINQSKKSVAPSVEEFLAKLGKECPKKFSGKAAAIGAGLGLVGTYILSKIFSSGQEG